MKRDTERQDEIRAMKFAWEAAQPGRAAKVTKLNQTRFINSTRPGCSKHWISARLSRSPFFCGGFFRRKKKRS